jgi:hypothetical protein
MNPNAWYAAEGFVGTILFGLAFGFGFAIGQWLWGIIVGAFHRQPKQP